MDKLERLKAERRERIAAIEAEHNKHMTLGKDVKRAKRLQRIKVNACTLPCLKVNGHDNSFTPIGMARYSFNPISAQKYVEIVKGYPVMGETIFQDDRPPQEIARDKEIANRIKKAKAERRELEKLREEKLLRGMSREKRELYLLRKEKAQRDKEEHNFSEPMIKVYPSVKLWS